MLVQLSPEALVRQVPVHVDQVTVLVHASPELVQQEALLVTLQVLQDLLSGLRVTVEETTNIVPVEVVALKIEGRRELTALVKLIGTEDLATFFFLKDVSSLGIDKVTFFVDTFSTLVN